MKLDLSILNLDYKNVEKDLNKLIDILDYVHLDVMDGVFVNNISFGPDFIKSIRSLTTKTFDTHLMIIDPYKYIKQFAEAGSEYITFHVEANSNVMDTINLIKSYNVKPGISIKPNTKVEEIKKYLPYVDQVLVMSVEPGFGGQGFMPNSIDKVKELYNLRKENNYNYLINIDGGINDKTITLVKDYIDMAVVGSYITKAADKVECANKIKNA